MTRDTTITESEALAQAQVESLDVDVSSMLAVSNIFRVANAVRNFTERNLLSAHGLTFTGFTVLWVLWVRGAQESGVLAVESGISKSTLTGVVKTLETQALVKRKPHATDGRRVFVHVTRKGRAKMRQIFPRFNAIEAEITAELSGEEKQALTRTLRIIMHSLESRDGTA